jgi:hypothetical protein
MRAKVWPQIAAAMAGKAVNKKGSKAMKYLGIVVAALFLLAGASTSEAQEGQSMPMGQMGGGGMMGHGMHHGMMMMRPNMLRVLVVMMDTDGDGALSLEEVQAVHARMFKAIDADKNGRVTLEEMQQFFRGQ